MRDADEKVPLETTTTVLARPNPYSECTVYSKVANVVSHIDYVVVNTNAVSLHASSFCSRFKHSLQVYHVRQLIPVTHLTVHFVSTRTDLESPRTVSGN